MSSSSPSPLLAAPPSSRQRAVTLKDVAARAGVGPMSVSVVLNGTRSPTRVSEATRKRILEVAEELGYRRNSSAAAARWGRFGNVALVMSTQSSNSYFNLGLFLGINEELARHNLLLTVVQLDDARLSDSEFMPQILRNLSCDGLLLDYTCNVPPRLLELIEKFQIPVVWLHIDRPDDSVFVDDEGAGFDATKHLLQLGHQRIVHLTYPNQQHDSGPNRRRGYESAMKSAGLAPWIEFFDPYKEPDTILDRMTSWFKSSDAPTAMFAYAADCALPSWLAAERLGRSVPQKFSLVATHHEEMHVLGRQLTCWELPVYDMGHEGVRLLLQKINSPNQPLPSKKLPFNVKLGSTCSALTS